MNIENHKKKKHFPLIRIILLLIVSLYILNLTCDTHRKDDYFSLQREYLKPDFWLSKLKRPDQLILTKKQITQLNNRVYKKKYVCFPINGEQYYRRYTIKKYLKWDLNWLKHFKKYDKWNNRINGQKIQKKMKKIINYYNIPKDIKRKYGLITQPTYLRVFPTDQMVMKKKDDVPFDIFQITFLDTGEPVSFFHISKDKKWGFVISAYRQGWIRLEDFGWSYEKKLIEKYHNSKKFILALDWEVPVFDSDDFKHIITHIHMGTKIPLVKKEGDTLIVKVPIQDHSGRLLFVKGYMPLTKQVSLNYLDCTPRNIANQAFKMLGEPYGWGGLNFNTDCSAYLRRVFLTMGIVLPRSSILQIKHLKRRKFKRKNKKLVLNKIKPFQTLLYCSGPSHIMLYLGKDKNSHFMIHNKWGFKKIIKTEEKQIFLKRVVITDLHLGKGSSEGSLFDRLVRISGLK